MARLKMTAKPKAELMKKSRKKKRLKAEILGLVEFRGWVKPMTKAKLQIEEAALLNQLDY